MCAKTAECDDPAAQWPGGAEQTVEEVADPPAEQQAKGHGEAVRGIDQAATMIKATAIRLSIETSIGCPRRMLPGPAKLR